ncbi:glycosyltransferase [Paraclostridium bifermentans]|uniref:glycosyltransferase n=1 Tax=Paraclostridium bifermentans TaxID=1490 RepID=UPI0034DF768F
MKILFLTQSNKKYGIESVMKTLIENINSEDYKIDISYIEKCKDDGMILDSDIKQYFLDRNYKSIFGIIEIVLKLKKIIKNNNYDLIYSAGTYCNIINCILSKICNKKHIISEHNLMSISIKSEGKYKIMEFLVRKFYKNSDKIVVVSNDIAKDLNLNYNISLKKVKTLGNPIEIEEVINKSEHKCEIEEKIKLLKKDGNIVLCNIANFKKAKNHIELVKSVKFLRNQGEKIKLILIGDGGLQSEIKEYVKDNELDEDILFIGYTNNPYSILRLCDAFILPSLWEGFGLVLIEAMGLGIPCITTNHSGSKYFINNYENGLICGTGFKEIAEKVNEFINLKDDKKSEIILKGYETSKNFDAKNISIQYIDLFEETCNKNKEIIS